MPRMLIDGNEHEFQPGQTVLQVAHAAGIDVPYFCYHPGLSIAGNCRMCLVEVEAAPRPGAPPPAPGTPPVMAPKPDISCNMQAREGLKVHTQTPNVKKLRAGIMEFLLLNHPLDCPVCDQAGECWLQEYYMDYARHPSAMKDHRTEKPKAQVLGPQVILDAERCILCTRCIRFLDEVTGTSELTIVERGGHARIDLFPGQRLENLYSSNVVDICPVGALTHRDFRFQQRVWFLKSQDTICNGCSNGCNLNVDYNGVSREVYRMPPRRNDDVNGFWMCDVGRTVYKPVNADSRVTTPMAGKSPIGWDRAAVDIAAQLKAIVDAFGAKSVAAVASPMSTTENLWAFKRFANEVLGTTLLTAELHTQVPATAVADASKLKLLKIDRTPNRSALETLWKAAPEFEKLRDGIRSGEIKALFVMETDLVRLAKAPDEMRSLLAKLPLLVAIASNHDDVTERAHVTLPAASFVEQDGTFVNHAGRVQRLHAAFAPLHESRPAWAILDYLAKHVRGFELGWDRASDVFAEIAARNPAFAGLSYERLGAHGVPLNSAAPAASAGAAT